MMEAYRIAHLAAANAHSAHLRARDQSHTPEGYVAMHQAGVACERALSVREDCEAEYMHAAFNALPSLLAVVSAAQAMQRAGAVYGPFQEGDLERAFDGLDQALAPFQGKEK